jgi:hypothetical protein
MDGNMHYVSATPRELKAGWTLAHNHIRHTVNMEIGRNGFRAWWFRSVPKGFEPCSCGWSGLPHVAVHPKYKCEPEKVIASFD